MSNYEAQKIEHWDDERHIGNSLIVTLKDGFCFDETWGHHVKGFDTKKEAISEVRKSVPCRCNSCFPGLYEIVE